MLAYLCLFYIPLIRYRYWSFQHVAPLCIQALSQQRIYSSLDDGLGDFVSFLNPIPTALCLIKELVFKPIPPQ